MTRPDIGAIWLDDGRCRFRVWAPFCLTVDLQIVAPSHMQIRMEAGNRGYHEVTLSNMEPSAQYLYRLASGHEHPDPASVFEPEGVHGPSQVPEREFLWEDAHWRGLPLEQYILYEIHVGTLSMLMMPSLSQSRYVPFRLSRGALPLRLPIRRREQGERKIDDVQRTLW
jgi:maltooligosyltrehalose trehalohydrolase